MCGGGGSDAAQMQAAQQQKWVEEQARKAEQREAERQAMLTRGNASIADQFAGFDDSYYNNIRSGYEAYTKPQIDREYGRTKDKVRFGLARGGLLESSAAAREFADLDTTFDAARVDASARANDLVANRRSQVEQNRANVTSQLYASENPEIALQSAQRASSSLQTAPAFEPISDILSQAAQFANRDYVNALYGTGGQGLFTPIFNNGSGGSSGSGKVIG